MGKSRANICLTGYMGCGKTSVGRCLANELTKAFKDTDEMIVSSQGRSIPDIFREEGEQYFRRLEHELLAGLVSDEGFCDTVLSTGGGIVMDVSNRGLLKELGTVFFLRAKPETLYKRVGADDGRPLLEVDDRFKKICEMLELRGPVYEECADHIIDTDALSVEDVTKKILEIWSMIV